MSPMDDFLSGKVVLITGATNGIGKGLFEKICSIPSPPQKIILIARNKTLGGISKELAETSGITCDLLLGDLAKPEDVFRLAREVRASNDQLHCLINNAGIFLTHKSPEKKNGVLTVEPLPGMELEIHFMVNFLAMVILVSELKSLLEKSSPARVVVTGSFTTWEVTKGQVQWDDLQWENTNPSKSMPNQRSYAHSKLLQHLWVKHYSTLLKGVTINVADPGLVSTNIGAVQKIKKTLGCCYPCVMKVMGGRNIHQGCLPLFHLCDSAEVEGKSGMYLDWGTSKLVKRDLVPMEIYPNYKNSVAPSTKDPEQCKRTYEYARDLVESLRPAA